MGKLDEKTQVCFFLRNKLVSSSCRRRDVDRPGRVNTLDRVLSQTSEGFDEGALRPFPVFSLPRLRTGVLFGGSRDEIARPRDSNSRFYSLRDPPI